MRVIGESVKMEAFTRFTSVFDLFCLRKCKTSQGTKCENYLDQKQKFSNENSGKCVKYNKESFYFDLGTKRVQKRKVK